MSIRTISREDLELVQEQQRNSAALKVLAEKVKMEDLEEGIRLANKNLDVLRKKTRMNASTKEATIRYWSDKLYQFENLKTLKEETGRGDNNA